MKEKINISIEQSLKTVTIYMRWISIVVIIGILFSGVTFVQSGEVALVFRFGKIVGDNPAEKIKKPGFHFALPYIIDKVVRVPVQKIQEVQINGLYTNSYIKDITKTGYALTGDNHIILANAVLKYKVNDPIQYAVLIENPEVILKEIATSSMTHKIASMRVDDVLTKKKKELMNHVLLGTQHKADQIGLGVQLIALEFTHLQPPKEVRSEFELVTSAFVKNETLLQKANGYKERVLLQAATERNSMIQKGKSFGIEKIALAKSEVAQFNGVIAEYNKNPEIVRERLYREKVENIMRKVANKIFIPNTKSGENIILP